MRLMVFVVMTTLCLTALNGCGGGSSAGGKDIPTVNVGSTTLFQAADDPSATAKLDMLITSGVDLNAKDKEGLTALHHAVNADNVNAVKRLLLAGADPSVKDGQGRTAEEIATQENKGDVLKVFNKLQ